MPSLRHPLALACLLGLWPALSGSVSAENLGLADQAAPAGPQGVNHLGADDASARPGRRYVIQLADQPLILYRGGTLVGLTPTGAEASDPEASTSGSGSPQPNADSPFLRRRPDFSHRPAVDYRSYLRRRQDETIAAIARFVPGASAQYYYDIAFNGIALRLRPEQAELARSLPGVIAVTEAERIVPLMDASLPLIGAPTAWADPRIGGRADAGRGVRIAVIDSGISAEHPMFSGQGFQAPEGFPQASWSVGERRSSYPPAELARYTNAKVIVARTYVNPEIYDAVAPPPSPLADGIGGFHGAHVAGTAAGVAVKGAPGSKQGGLDLSGVAPGAYLMAYKFSQAYSPEILAMIDDAVADGADVINNSWGTSAMNVMDPDLHPVSQAFKAAHASGVVVVAAAGNAGLNGEATLGGPHQMIDEVITVANSQTGRGFAYTLTAADAGLPETLQRHPAAYEAFDNDFNVIEKAAVRLPDFCNVLGLALNARNKVILEPTSGSCEIPGLPIGNLPIPEQFGFLTKLLLAGITNATAGGFGGPPVESIVFYAPEGDPAQLAAALGLLEQFAPLLGQLGINVRFPVVAMIAGPQALELAAWADGHKSLKLRLDATPERVLDPAAQNLASPSSSQGPSPNGTVKPDLSAPGTDVVSVNTNADGSANGYALASGTSMSSPHVAGAAALLRQAWPALTPSQVKAALLASAAPVIRVGQATAPATVQGAGRLDLARALNPGLALEPSALALDRAALFQRDIRFVRLQDLAAGGAGDRVYKISHEPGAGLNPGMIFAVTEDSTVTVPAGGSVDWRLPLTAGGGLPAPGSYDGRLVFRSADHVVQLPYRFVMPGDRKDVLLLELRRTSGAGGGGIPGLPGGGGFSDGADHRRYWTEALTAAGLSYDVWSVAAGERAGTPPLGTLQAYDLVVLAAGDGNAPLDQLEGGMTALQMALLGGGRLLVSGWNYPHTPPGGLGALNLQTSGAMYFLSRYFAGFERVTDDAPGGSALLTPVRLFQRPLRLSSAAGTAAGNGGRLDLGRPLAALTTLAQGGGGAGGGSAPDLGIAAPGVVSRLQPYMRSYLEVDGGGSAMTGVTADATLEQPERAAFIAWRALFAGFAAEAISGAEGSESLAGFLEQVHAWAVEPSDLRLDLGDPRWVEVGKPITLIAEAQLPSEVQAAGWRWDRGDGGAYIDNGQATLSLRFNRPGHYRPRVELRTARGHTYVAETAIQVLGPRVTYLPFLFKQPRR